MCGGAPTGVSDSAQHVLFLTQSLRDLATRKDSHLGECSKKTAKPACEDETYNRSCCFVHAICLGVVMHNHVGIRRVTDKPSCRTMSENMHYNTRNKTSTSKTISTSRLGFDQCQGTPEPHPHLLQPRPTTYSTK